MKGCVSASSASGLYICIVLVATAALLTPIAGFGNIGSCFTTTPWISHRCASVLCSLPMSKRGGDGNTEDNINNSKEDTFESSSNNSSIEDVDHQQQQQQQQRRNPHKELVEAAILKSRAQAELERLLSDPNAPFDREGAVAKLPVIPAVMDAIEKVVEDQVSELERVRVHAANEKDFITAQKARDELYRAHIDDCGHVLQVNAAFYKAFNDFNFEQMKSVWLNTEEVQCIHPSHPPLVGYDTVISSWKDVFDTVGSTITSSQAANSVVEPANTRLISLKGCTALLVCEEHIYRTSLQRGVGRKRELVKKMQSTNVFRKVDGQWYMVHHHGSWHADYDSTAMTSSNYNIKSQQHRARQQLPRPIRNHRGELIQGPAIGGVVDVIRKIYFGNPNEGKSASSSRSNDNAISKLIMGGGSGGDIGNASGENKNVRIFRGSLSDFLKGGMLEALTSGAGKEEENDDDVDDDVDDDDDEEDVYHVNKEGVAWIDASEENDDDDDDSMEEEEDDDESEEEYLRKVLNLRKKGRWEGGKYIPRKNNDEKQSSSIKIIGSSSAKRSSDSSNGKSINKAPPAGYKDEMRQNCISALRRLCNQGSISPKQKRALLTDIITCSSKGDFSMVEVAYELLCGEGDDKDAAEEEFADQCRVFARSFSSTTGEA